NNQALPENGKAFFLMTCFYSVMPAYYQVQFQNLKPGQQEILIAVLADGGYEGFEETDPGLKAFIPKQLMEKEWLDKLAGTYGVSYALEEIPEQNWNQAWESGFNPVVVDDFVSIRAIFHEPVKNVEHELIITPKMSFGTGHHATTSMMVRLMREIEFNDRSVFDFGTGTGILSILAEKLGAAEIMAIDNDDWSIANAAENIAGNQCTRIILEKSERLPESRNFDIILANINKNVILEHFHTLAQHLASGGTLLLSGLLKEDEAEIVRAGEDLGLNPVLITASNGWICLRFSH
ncbi:MAG: 50S ribosomal protein L11 methyltransferase, partial [Chitinophagaceae bacterium]